MERRTTKQTKGILYAGGAYLVWGILPLYWKLIQDVSAEEILAQRVFWSFIFMLIVLLLSGKWGDFIAQCKKLLQHPKSFIMLTIASLLISINWFLYIWAVNHNHIIETSLGYYINPLVSILLGTVVLKERLNVWQIVAVGLATVGVAIMTMRYGAFPWIALTLAFTFGLYGLVKKLINFEAAIGLTFETLVVTPFAFFYLGSLQVNGTLSFGTISHLVTFLLIGAGAATAVPLLYFAKGAKLIPLTMIGFLQYIAPTISLCIGVFLYGERFTSAHAVAFGFIWAALITFSFAKTKFMIARQPKIRKKKRIEIS